MSIANKILENKKLKESEVYDLGTYSNSEYNNIKNSIIDKIHLRNAKFESLNANLSAYLTKGVHLKKISDNPLTFTARAGDKLNLILKIEGGSGEYTMNWKINGRSPKDAIGRLFSASTDKNEVIEKIETLSFKTIEEKKGDQKLLEDMSKGNRTMGAYDIDVTVYDVHTKKSSKDEIRIIVMMSMEKERELEKALKLLEKETKAIKGEKKTKIISVECYNDKERGYNVYQKNGIYLLHLDKKINLKCKKEKLIKRVVWSIWPKGNERQVRWLGEGEEIKGYDISRRIFSEGLYVIQTLAYINDTDKEPINTESVDVYIKDSPEVTALICPTKQSNYAENGKYETLERGISFFIKSHPNEATYFKLRAELTNKSGINYDIKKLINKSGSDKNIKIYTTKNIISGLLENEAGIFVEKSAAGIFNLRFILETRDNFGYMEDILIERNLTISTTDIRQLAATEHITELNKIYYTNLRPLIMELINLFEKEIVYEYLKGSITGTGQNRLETLYRRLEGDLESIKQLNEENEAIDRYSIEISAPAKEILSIEKNILGLLEKMNQVLDSPEMKIDLQFMKLKDELYINEVLSKSMNDICEDLINSEKKLSEWPNKNKIKNIKIEIDKIERERPKLWRFMKTIDDEKHKEILQASFISKVFRFFAK